MKSVGQEKQDAWEEWNNLEQSCYEEEKYKKLYDKALTDLVKAEHDNIKKDKIIEAMAVCILAREIGKPYFANKVNSKEP